ncbi:MAG: hypothetical protein ACK41C_10435 [Phenylobacterium sp.]|uniref:hypothetical protein n=1 Tax=Phenylobacterium sp. TaxID=1871053 RepID=UPI00391AB502
MKIRLTQIDLSYGGRTFPEGAVVTVGEAGDIPADLAQARLDAGRAEPVEDDGQAVAFDVVQSMRHWVTAQRLAAEQLAIVVGLVERDGPAAARAFVEAHHAWMQDPVVADLAPRIDVVRELAAMAEDTLSTEGRNEPNSVSFGQAETSTSASDGAAGDGLAASDASSGDDPASTDNPSEAQTGGAGEAAEAPASAAEPAPPPKARRGKAASR